MTESARPEVPAELGDLEDDALTSLTEKLTAEFDRLLDEGTRDVAAMTALADDIDKVNAEVKLRETAAAEADAAIAQLTERVKGSSTEPDPEPDPEPEPEPEPDEPVQEEAAAPEKELVTASAAPAAPAKPALRDIARRVPKPKPESKPTLTITAAADLPGIMSGSTINLLQVAEAMHDRARDLSDTGTDRRKVPIARMKMPHTHWVGTDAAANVKTIDDLVGQPTAAALVASGGWCAPSEPIFEMFDLGPDSDNLFDLPSLGSNVRAGVMIPTFYDISDVTDALWNWTEADDISAADGDPTKPCLKIPCPTWAECRLEAEGLCVTHGNLSDRAWPELTTQFISIVMGAYRRRLSAAKIAKVIADTVTVTPGAAMTPSDAAGDLLNVISLAAADLRSMYRVSKSRAVDVLLPDWALEVLRSNMAMRQGVWDAMNVPDSQITGWLSARGVRVQFTPDWQPLSNGTAPTTTWPANVTFAIWFSGSYVSIDGGTLDLGVVRDSTLNATNDFTAAWMETFYQVCRRGPQGRQYTVPLSVDGVTGCCPAAAA